MLRTLAFEIVFGVMEEQGHSDELFHALVEDSGEARGRAASLSGQERAFVRRLSYGTIERALFLDAVIDCYSRMPSARQRPVIRTILRMGVYELMYMDSVPAAATCNEMVALARKKGFHSQCGYVNGCLRNIARADREELLREVERGAGTRENRLSVLYSAPEELVHMLVQSYGRRTAEKMLASFFEDRPMTVRVQTMNAAKEQVREAFLRSGATVSDGNWVQTALRIERAGRVEELPGFAEGHFAVQDESAMLPVLVSGVRPGDLVVDACSSPGGKALHAADVMRGEGVISARDISEQKLRRIRENVERLGAPNVDVRMWDATVSDEEWRGRADVVFVDVPCSGIGVIGKKPEIKYRAMQHSGALTELQREIVAGAATALKPGGVLIYSTCTVHPPENEEMAAWIEEALSLRPVSLDEFLPEELRNRMTERGQLQILPGLQGGDGFFIAKFKKK